MRILRRPLAVAVGVFVAVVALTFSYDSMRSNREQQRQRAVASLEVERLVTAMDAIIATETAEVAALSQLVQQDGLDAGDLGPRFSKVAAAFLRGGNPIRSVQLAPDGIIRYVYPIAGNEAAIGLDLMADPERARILGPTIASGMASLQGPFALVQGGTGLIVRKPIYEMSGDYWGFAAILLDWPSVEADIGFDRLASQWLVGIRETGRDTLLAGTPAAFREEPVSISQRMGGTTTGWTVAIRPIGGWSRVARDSGLVRLGGLLVAILAAWVAYLSARRPEMLERERAAALAELARSEERFQTTFLHAGVGIAIADVRGRLRIANPAFLDMLGTRGLEPGIDMLDLVVDEDRRRLKRAMLRAHRTGALQTLEMRMTTDRGLRWGRLRLTTTTGPDDAFIGIVEDITDQRSAEMALAESEDRFRMLVEHAPIGIQREDHSAVKEAVDAAIADGVDDVEAWFRADPRRRMALMSRAVILDSNPEADLLHARFGQPSGVIPLSERFTEESSIGYTGTVLAMSAGESVFEQTVPVSGIEGEEIWLYIRWQAPMLDGVPDYSNILVTLRDVTDLHRRQERLEDEIASKDQFIASVAHELRTPLTAVVGFAHELQDTSGIYGIREREEFVNLIAFHSAELAHLIEDLLVWARADIGEVRINPTVLDVGSAVTETVSALPGIDIPVEVHGRPMATADPRRLGQILRNLATNAVRYGGPDRRVDVFVDGDEAVVEVSDDGAEMSPEDMARVFAPYERADGSTSMPGSIGLGLTVSRTLSVLQSGNLTVDRRDGRTVFRLTLPLAEPMSVRSRQSSAEATTSRAAS